MAWQLKKKNFFGGFPNKTNIFFEKKKVLKCWYFLDFRPDSELDPDLNETDPDRNKTDTKNWARDKLRVFLFVYIDDAAHNVPGNPPRQCRNGLGHCVMPQQLSTSKHKL